MKNQKKEAERKKLDKDEQKGDKGVLGFVSV